MRWLALAFLALTLTGCETTQEKAARLEKLAALHQREAAKHAGPAQRGLSIAHESTRVKVLSASLVRSSEGIAAVVTLRNTSAVTMRDVPVAITVKSPSGVSIYANNAPGLAPTLVAVPLLGAHAQTTWIDDQIQANGTPAQVSARVGEGEAVKTAVPRLSLQGTRVFEDPTNGPGVEGTLVNHSAVTQQELVVYALARSAGRVVAAGRAILTQAAAGASTRFQIFFIGDPRKGKLEVSAPPSTFG